MSAPVSAEESEPAAETAESSIALAIEFAKAMTADATAALTDETASEETQLENFRVVLAEGMALETISRFMLGESRKSMNEEQTSRYEAIFPRYITKLYAEQFDEIVGKPLEVVDAKEIGERDVIVRTRFERKDDSPIMVDWRVRQLRSGERKAIDIIVSGVSIMLVKREEFSSFIASNGLDALIERLEQDAQA
jgi:ABC-type transporter MlaC component